MTCTAGVFTQFYASAGWDCNSTVQFYSNNSSLAQSVANAVGEWQTRLAATGFSDLPTFTTTSVLTQAEATATGTHLGSAFCGNWDNDSRVLQVFSDTGCGVEFDNKGPLANLLLQKWGTR